MVKQSSSPHHENKHNQTKKMIVFGCVCVVIVDEINFTHEKINKNNLTKRNSHDVVGVWGGVVVLVTQNTIC